VNQHIVASVRIFFGRKFVQMKDIQLTTKNDGNHGGNGYKIIEINVSDPSENTFAVVTPIKMK
jgi:hypothetical protein